MGNCAAVRDSGREQTEQREQANREQSNREDFLNFLASAPHKSAASLSCVLGKIFEKKKHQP